VLINYLGSDCQTVFTTLVLMAGITSAIPYGFSALAQIKWRLADRKQLETARFARDMTVAIVALLFSLLFIWYSRNTGHGFWIYWGPFHDVRRVPARVPGLQGAAPQDVIGKGGGR
jgi:APA family basic amino acid/polyamine antiporter